MVYDRLVNNRAIIHKLAELVEKYPDQRFIQLLVNTGILDSNMSTDGTVTHVGNYNKESRDTWREMTENSVCFPPSDNG